MFNVVYVNGMRIKLSNSDVLTINGKYVPAKLLNDNNFGDSLKQSMIVGKNGEVTIGNNVFRKINGRIYVNGKDLLATPLHKKYSGEEKQVRKQLINSINSKKHINNYVLKYCSTELLEKLNNLDDKLFKDDTLHFYSKSFTDKTVEENKRTGRFVKNAYYGIPMGIFVAALDILLIISCIISGNLGSLFTIFVLAVDSGIFLGPSIPRAREERIKFKEKLIDLVETQLETTVERLEAEAKNDESKIDKLTDQVERMRNNKVEYDRNQRKQADFERIFSTTDERIATDITRAIEQQQQAEEITKPSQSGPRAKR